MKTAALRVPRLAVAIAALSAISTAWAVAYPVDDFPAGETPLTDVTMHNYSGSNASATQQSGDPMAGKTVWWAWNAESTATVYFST